MSENLNIWDAVQATDPKYTKAFNRGGGFKGTATNATYLAKKATEQFGPCGIGWGVNVVNEQLITGAPHMSEGVVIANDIIHKLHVKFWYVRDGMRGEIEQFGQTQMVGKNKNGFYTDEEAPKKSMTDAMSKCLSLLGFSADIHLGLYDDNKYVSEMQEKFTDRISAEQAATIRDFLESTTSDVSAFLKWLGAESVESIRADDFNKAMAALKKKASG